MVNSNFNIMNQKETKAREVLNNLVNEKNFADEIIQIVGDFYDVNLFEDTNRPEISVPRCVAIYLVKEYTNKLSYDYLARLFNRKAPNFIITVRKLKDSLPYDKYKRKELKQLNSLITLSKGYGNSVAKNSLIHDTVILLNELNQSQVEQFYDIFNNYKVNNLEVVGELVI